MFVVTAIGLGTAGTTLLSRWRGEFTFTWCVPLFVMFDACVWRAAYSHEAFGIGRRWRRRIADVLFLLTCGGYFWLCRRLSLPTEWMFLAGFPCALPILYWGYRRARDARSPRMTTSLTILLAFTAYFWSAVLLLALKYEIP